jgi:hypothetical protein
MIFQNAGSAPRFSSFMRLWKKGAQTAEAQHVDLTRRVNDDTALPFFTYQYMYCSDVRIMGVEPHIFGFDAYVIQRGY